MKRKRSSSSDPESEEVIANENKNNELDQLIEERKQEKRKALEEELQRKLSTIRARRTSGMSVTPFPVGPTGPVGTFERLQSNDVFGNILEYLTDPTDVMDACFAGRTFAEILEKRRILMALPKVLSVFKTKVDDAYDLNSPDTEDGIICYENWLTICLNSRGVSKAWKETVDIHFNIAREKWLLTTDWTIQDDYRTNVFSFEEPESVENATSSLIELGLTVSPIRDVFVLLGERVPVAEQHIQKLMDYFKAHGQSVRYLTFHYKNPESIASAGVYEKLCEMLKCMGNLKILRILFYDDVDDDDDDDEMLDFQDDQQPPLPALEFLEYFSCFGWKGQESVVTQILKNSINLKSVNLHLTEPTSQETTDALMQLTLERFEGLSTIITSYQVTWPLKHLKIFADYGKEMDASVLIPAINRFHETLEHLHIWGPIKMEEYVRYELQLPHLKTCFIKSIQKGRLGFDDLLQLKSLEKIIVERSISVEYEDENAKVKVKAFLESGEMRKSNVWQLFPKLMRFEVQLGRVCCRPTPS